MKANDLEKRLIQFSVNVIQLHKSLDNSFASEHLIKQLIRSATSVALNYGEARSGESNKDFLHKMIICLKELRECYVNIKIMQGANLVKKQVPLNTLLNENDELISIFVASVKTANSKIKKSSIKNLI